MPEQPLPPQRSPPQGSRSPVHAVADPGITDSWAMPRVPPSAPLLGFANCNLCAFPEPPRPHPGLGRTGGTLRSWDGSGFLQLQVGPHPPGHVTGEGAAPAGRLELALRGPSLLLVPSAWDLAPALASPGSSARRKRVSLRLKSSEGPSLRANAHECEPYTLFLRTRRRKTRFSQPTLGLTVSPACLWEQLEPGFLRESFILSGHSNGASSVLASKL